MSRGGRHRGKPHMPVESCHSLSVWGYWQVAQIWESDESFHIEWKIGETHADLEFTRDRQETKQQITLEFTYCKFGNRRAWFMCPKCGRRVAKVYLPATIYEGGKRVREFRCRFCYDLTYLQRREGRFDKTVTFKTRADRIAAQRFDREYSFPVKPKYMHCDTYDRYVKKWQVARARADSDFVRSALKVLAK